MMMTTSWMSKPSGIKLRRAVVELVILDAFIQADSHDKLVRFLRLVKKAEKLR